MGLEKPFQRAFGVFEQNLHDLMKTHGSRKSQLGKVSNQLGKAQGPQGVNVSFASLCFAKAQTLARPTMCTNPNLCGCPKLQKITIQLNQS